MATVMMKGDEEEGAEEDDIEEEKSKEKKETVKVEKQDADIRIAKTRNKDGQACDPKKLANMLGQLGNQFVEGKALG